MSTLVFVLLGLAAAVTLVILVAPYADANPDGLEKVAADHGIDAGSQDQALANGPLADYGVDGVGNRYLSTSIAGVLGVTVTFAMGAASVYAVRRARRRAGPPPAPA